MMFHQILNELGEKIGDSCHDLFNNDLLKTIDNKLASEEWNFDKIITKHGEVTKIVTMDDVLLLKDQGNQLFRSNQLQESCKSYTNYLKSCHGLLITDEIKNKMIYQGYANRSTVLFKALDRSMSSLHEFFPNIFRPGHF